MEALFERCRKNPPISKSMPPKAGAIAWARSIMARIKAPIHRFTTREGMLTTERGKEVARMYI